MDVQKFAKVMSSEGTPISTAVTASKKRELTSPEFDVDTKKNKCASASSVSDLDLDISIDLENPDKSGEIMASNATPALSIPSASVSSEPSPHVVIPPAEMLKISEMLKETFRGEIVTMVDSVVAGVLKGSESVLPHLNSLTKLLSKKTEV